MVNSQLSPLPPTDNESEDNEEDIDEDDDTEEEETADETDWTEEDDEDDEDTDETKKDDDTVDLDYEEDRNENMEQDRPEQDEQHDQRPHDTPTNTPESPLFPSTYTVTPLSCCILKECTEKLADTKSLKRHYTKNHPTQQLRTNTTRIALQGIHLCSRCPSLTLINPGGYHLKHELECKKKHALEHKNKKNSAPSPFLPPPSPSPPQ
jgi:hypothetical protein